MHGKKRETQMNRLKSKIWWDKATVRAIKTAAQSGLAVVGTGSVGLMQVDWLNLLSIMAMSVILSYVTSLAGLPEVDPNEDTNE